MSVRTPATAALFAAALLAACSVEVGPLPSSDGGDELPADAQGPLPTDASSSGLDAALPSSDASTTPADAAEPGTDASAGDLDASLPPDSSAPPPDASGPAADDASSPGLDASSPDLDASSPAPDAAGPGLDAASPGADAASPGLDGSTTVPPDASAPPPIPRPVFGVTADAIDNFATLKDALASLGRKPTVRVVFDVPEPASTYSDAVESLHQVAYVMGQPMDSSYVTGCPLDLTARLDDYLGDPKLLANVDVWEIGNEINGEWLCEDDPALAYATARQAYDRVKALGKPTALTLFWYDDSCAPAPKNEMLTWVDQHVEQDVRLGLDYVFVSVYETACPPPASWTPVFDALAQRFPNSWLGFGETGTENQAAPYATKLDVLNRYYGLAPMSPRFVGGDFWWYFAEDMVPKTQPLWLELDKFSTTWSTLYP